MVILKWLIIAIVLVLIIKYYYSREKFRVMQPEGNARSPIKVCPPNYESRGGLCFEKCKPGYMGEGHQCKADCTKLYGPNYFNNGTDCRKFTPPTSVKPRPIYNRDMSVFEKMKCQKGYQGTLFVGDDRMCHPDCPPGYNKFAGKCWGQRDLKLVLDKIMTCGDDQDLLVSTNGEARCFNKCKPGYKQKGDMCVAECEKFYSDDWHNVSGRCYKWWPLQSRVEPKYYRGPGKLLNDGGLTIINNLK